MKCRIREIITTASAVALTVAAAPAATAYAASVDDAQAVISENVGEAVAVTRLATASETTTWNKAVTLTEDTVVDGNLNITANVDLNGYTLTVNGDINHSAGTITCSSGILNINGSYYIGSTTQYAATDLILSEDSDEVNINGDLVTYYISNNHGILQNAGTITVSGDVNASNGFIMSTENNTVLVLNGKSDQNVNFGNCPTLNILKVNDPEKREIIWNGNMNVRHFASDIINVKSESLKLANIDLENTTMVVNGDCSIANKVDINGGQLTINGNLYHPDGTIICNNGTLNINGTYFIGRTNIYANTDLILSEDSDEVNINGDLVTYYISDNHGILQDAGTITVSGDINAISGLIMNTENNTVLVLNGQSDQNVNFVNCPTLNTLKVIDSEKREIVWNGNMNVRHFASDINVKSESLKFENIDLENTNMVVNGDCSIANKVDINGGQLTINGNLIHSDGTILCNNGTLNINGTYYIGRTNIYANTDLILSEDSDEVNINGDLVAYYISDNNGILQDAGTITVSGDINAISGLNINTDNYTVLKLNGMSKQKITLPNGTKINVLVINKFMSCYDFNQKECWNELITDYPAYYPAVVIKKWEKGNGAVKLTWDAVPGAEKYAIAGYVNGKWTVLNYGYKTSYVLKGLKPGVNYKVAVVAKIGGKWYTDVSKAVVVTPKSVNKYPVVTSEVSGKQFRLNWKAADAAEKYAIAVYQSGKWVVKAQLNGDVTSYTSPKLNNGTYKIVVCAKVNGKWDLSNINSRAINVTIK